MRSRIPDLRAASAAVFRLRGRNGEGMVAAMLILLAIVVGIANGQFWSLATLFSIFRNSYGEVLFALGVLIVLLMGGVDVSFDSIGIFAGYSVVLLATHGVFDGGVAIAYTMAAGIGLVLGAVNASAIVGLRLPVLIVTLGTRGLFAGILLSFIGSNYINMLPGGLAKFYQFNLVRVSAHVGGQSVGLHMLVIPVTVICLLVWMMLRHSMFGRGIYAIGGDEEAARRAGLPVVRVKFLAFCLAGALAGLAGMTHVALIGFANPYDLVGNELNVIAAVVLGGASIFGGRGSVGGTVLGVLLISLINYSLILLGIPSAWNAVAVGVLILIGVGAQVTGRRRARAMVMRTIEETT